MKKSIYFSFILLFFLFTLISSDYPSNFKFQNGEQSLIINGSGNNNFTLKNSQSSPENYTLNLSIVIKETFSDELSFELLYENNKTQLDLIAKMNFINSYNLGYENYHKSEKVLGLFSKLERKIK